MQALLDSLPSSLLKIGILFSGQGSNMQNLIETLHLKPLMRLQNNQPLILKVEICATNNPKAMGIKRCKQLNMPCVVCSNEEELFEILYPCHLVCLAGFNQILSPKFLERFLTINIHPSFLPEHKGKDAIKRSFLSQKGTGVSVHFVEEKVDSGPIILQEALEVKKEESLEDFEKRVHTLEYQLYPQALLKALELRFLT
ncbi:formyltransferase family protein [Helicobacter suis]|uniref:phosphoribosylglycinamide formyltransferase 1 n=1 Tax=Helicobacter suis TaxID=104628 RepID=A0ABM7L1I7_9HELI|nr:formyltransferase family protein [Helicobacter suis]BCD46519.1 phosphoribosylglycinamide formyltransferase [Helicobacter suis]BCD47573.1 phosphoribosylglycinamide formyltransferase [Helicobacter suis]BCD49327.1 phosphoribosylglycinamide formyltransferase [Helicobacter suis]BCD51362.1 phosphoribosylglycinamide formyltransferase [Helicobacter suis]BDR28624.1 phosphoribosylglycinamide formyltransferase [Helicobacter suis HS1]